MFILSGSGRQNLDIPSSAQCQFFFFFLWSCLEGDIEFPLLGGRKKFG